MRKSSRSPSDWLKLLCANWAKENPTLVDGADEKLIALKPFLNGQLSCQLLCRLSIPDPPTKHELAPQHIVDFWKGLGIENDFDRIFIVSQVERFCTFYNVRGLFMDEEFMLEPPVLPCPPLDPNAPVTPVGIGSAPPFTGPIPIPPYPIANGMESAAAAAAAYAAAAEASDKLSKRQRSLVDFTNPAGIPYIAKDIKKLPKAEQRRLTHVRKEARIKEREAESIRRAADKAAREATREERRQKKIMVRLEREKYAQHQKEAALKRAAELVRYVCCFLISRDSVQPSVFCLLTFFSPPIKFVDLIEFQLRLLEVRQRHKQQQMQRLLLLGEVLYTNQNQRRRNVVLPLWFQLLMTFIR